MTKQFQGPENVTFSPKNVANFRYEEDLVWIVIKKKDFDNGLFFGKTFSYFSVACQYAREYPDTEWVISLA